ncbi:lipoprotein-releasing ABC transporter permease subunit [Thiobacter aerophilum]|uniref:Lipoprotein-releasing ABC transporter permease subunit n=1 Tax=Thiobacter aerophilum TaxID=3121275 RepID=A0ABV0ECD9_9BURK
MPPYELFVGLRYMRAKRRNHFISFISLISTLGIALGIVVLITVLSVMNGFQEELRSRILGVASHVEISAFAGPLEDWREVIRQAQTHPRVQGAAPYIMAQGMLSYDQAVQGAVIRGIEPKEEDTVADIGRHMKRGRLTDLKPGGFGIVLGIELAQALGVRVGDKLTVIAPQGTVTPAGILPRLKQFTVVGIFEVDMNVYDSGLALIHIQDAARLYRMGDAVSGVRLKLADLFAAPEVSRELAAQLPGNLLIRDWTQQNANFFRAIQMEKRVMFVIMFFIVAVAAFNIVSTLVMVVTDKQADIAILRTLGATPASIMKIFIVQGTLIGLIGTVAGVVGGVLLASHIDVVVPAIERLFGVHFLAKDVYYISELPSQVQATDVISIGVVSFLLSLLATLYPSWRAARTHPAEALRYE